ncbi:MAG: GntR family transcriptional regulator [Enterobacteriaceae bacterium]
MESLLHWIKQNLVASAAPRYMQLAKTLEQGIRQQIFRPGDFLPAERILADSLQLSRVTVSKALSLLEKKQLVQRKQGQGTQVIHHIDYRLHRDQGLTTQIVSQHVNLENQWLLRSKLPASAEIAASLQLDEGDLIAHLRRIRLADGVPISLENTYIPHAFLPDPETLEGSLYALWREHNIVATERNYRLRAVPCSSETAILLNIPAATPLLSIRQLSVNSQGAILELSDILCRGDCYELLVQDNDPESEE